MIEIGHRSAYRPQAPLFRGGREVGLAPLASRRAGADGGLDMPVFSSCGDTLRARRDRSAMAVEALIATGEVWHAQNGFE